MAITSRRGSALLTVLWISAALAALGFALANTVRGETERASTSQDELRAYYLATGAIDRAAIEVLWTAVNPDISPLPRRSTRVDYAFPTGLARVEIIPETAKFDINNVDPDRLVRLLLALGADSGRAHEIVIAIQAWRAGRGAGFSSLPASTFPGPGSSFQEIEELLAVRGVTPELFWGTYLPAPEGGAGPVRLVKRAGLVDCVSIFGTRDRVDANTAEPAVLLALGIPETGVQALVLLRSRAPLDMGKLGDLMPQLGPGGAFLRLEGNSIITLRATASVRLPDGRLSDVRRTVAAQVKYMPNGYDSPIHILRWYDTAWSQ